MRLRLLPILAVLAAAAALAAAPASAQPGRSYLIPPDNPYARGGGAPEVWAYGLRNPYRFSFDRATGNLLIGDVGGSQREEVNFRAAGRGGANFGWSCREGKLAGPRACQAPGAIDPIFEYPTVSPAAITAGYVVRDPALTGLVGRFLYADYYNGDIRSIRVDPAAPDDRTTGIPSPNLSSFGEDTSGRLYVTDLVGGVVYRLTAGVVPGTLSRTQVASGFDMVTHVAQPPGDGSRLFVVEQPGRVKVIVNGTPQGEPFLDISNDVNSESLERGMYSIAFPPDYAISRRFYLYFTDNDGDIRIVEYRRSATNPNRADPATRRVLLTIEHSARPNHNGGQLQFGSDGYLYIGTGDGGGQGDPDSNGQNVRTHLGKILRIDADPTTSAPARDITRPRLRTRVPRRQRVRRRRGPGVIAYARCNENCTVAMSARVRIGRRSYGLRRITRRAQAGRRIKLRVRLTRRSSRALRRSLRLRRRSTVSVALRARDAAGNRTSLRRARVRVLR